MMTAIPALGANPQGSDVTYWMDEDRRRQPILVGTTIVCVRNEHAVALGGDGQITMGDMVVKTAARKVRRIAEGRVLVGFAGSTADAMTLYSKLEKKLKEHQHQLMKAAVELAREWRTDRYLRRLEAMLIATDLDTTLLLSGTGDVIQPDDGVVAIGSGSGYALGSARSLQRHTAMSPREICEASLMVASELCVYTSPHLTIEELHR
jgi:ATP-dependent HslUV protease subunit HslV